MYTISKNGSAKSIIKHIKYKLNAQQYIETDRESQSVVDPLTREAPPTEGDGVLNIGRLVQFRNPLCEGRKIGTAAAAS